MTLDVLEAPGIQRLGETGAALPPRQPRPESGDGGRPQGRFEPNRFGLWAFLATISMLFIGFTSALMLRRASFDWQPLAAPKILWFNTAALLCSSLTLEAARRRQRRLDLSGSAPFVYATGLLGAVFAFGQWLGWQALRAQGIFLATNPHSSFFYLLTGMHLLHLSGGLAWYGVIVVRLRRPSRLTGDDGLSLFATYWHFLGLLWLYLLFVLFAL